MLSVSNLQVSYGAIRALHGVSLQVKQGEIVTLIGCNGAGKTTTLRAISGLVRAASGSVNYEGRDITRVRPHELVRMGIAHSPEGRGVFANLTVEENLELGAYARNDHAAIAQDKEKGLALFPRLRERLKQLSGTLSGGEQQMLAIGRGLMAEPRLLILDEPSLGLSPLLVEEMFALVRRINAEGLAVLLVEQNVVQSLDVASRAFILENGAFALQGDARELAASDELRRAYLGM